MDNIYEALNTHKEPAIFACGGFLMALIVPQLKSPTIKKWVSTVLGVVAVVGLCGQWGTFHLVLMAVVNAVVIVWGNKRHCFVISFFYTFTHLSLFYAEYLVTWLPKQTEHNYGFMMFMSLKIVQLAGEVQDTFLSDHKKKDPPARMKVYSALSYYDVMHYAFCHVGVLTFFRYRTYYDWLHFPRCSRAKYWGMTLDRIKDMAMIAVFARVSSLVWPYDHILAWDQYSQHALHIRVFYSIWSGIGTFLFLCALFMCGELICMSSGMGAYPTATNPKPGRGPTQRFDLLEQIELDPRLADLQEYNLETVRNIYIRETLLAPTFRSFWKRFSVCVQYGLVEIVYKRLPYPMLRVPTLFFVSTLWHGFLMGRYIGSLCHVVYLIAEGILYDIFMKNATGFKARIFKILFWASHLFATSILCLVTIGLHNRYVAYRYLASIWFLPVVYPFALLIIGLWLRSNRKGIAYKKDG